MGVGHGYARRGAFNVRRFPQEWIYSDRGLTGADRERRVPKRCTSRSGIPGCQQGQDRIEPLEQTEWRRAASSRYDRGMTREASNVKLRLQRILDRSNELITTAASGHGTVTAIPTIGARSRVVTYRLRIKGALVEPDWEFELADILLNVRSLLDNLVWQLAHADPSATYTHAEERLITFPISETKEKWDQTVRTKPHLKRYGSRTARSDSRAPAI